MSDSEKSGRASPDAPLCHDYDETTCGPLATEASLAAFRAKRTASALPDGDLGDCTFTERESAIAAFRKIMALVGGVHGPVYDVACEELSALAYEQRRASAITACPKAPESDLPLGLRTSPEKARQALAVLSKVGNPEDWLQSLVDGAVKETIALCVAAIRERAAFMTRAGYADGPVAAVRHVAYWLESDAGHDTLEFCDAVIDGERHGS